MASMILLLLARSRLLPTDWPVLMKASLLRSNAAGSHLNTQIGTHAHTAQHSSQRTLKHNCLTSHTAHTYTNSHLTKLCLTLQNTKQHSIEADHHAGNVFKHKSAATTNNNSWGKSLEREASNTGGSGVLTEGV